LGYQAAVLAASRRMSIIERIAGFAGKARGQPAFPALINLRAWSRRTARWGWLKPAPFDDFVAGGCFGEFRLPLAAVDSGGRISCQWEAALALCLSKGQRTGEQKNGSTRAFCALTRSKQ